MAEEKKILMKEYNGTDYDTLYPQSIIENIIGGIKSINGTTPSSDGTMLLSDFPDGIDVGNVKLTEDDNKLQASKPLSWESGGTSSTSQQDAVSMIFGYGYADWQSVTSYPAAPGIYRAIGTDIFQNLTAAHGLYGVLLIAKAGYGLHLYADNGGRLFWGRSGDTFGEPETWQRLDGIVEEGTSGIWTYRKYASGLAECWGRQTCSGTASTAWGSLYALVVDPNPYPFTFTALPTVERSALQSGSGNSSFLVSWSAESTTSPGRFALVRPTSTTVSSVVNIYACGKWK